MYVNFSVSKLGRWVLPVTCCLLVVLLALPGNAQAGKKPSVDNCSDLEILDVYCYVSATGRMIGKVSIPSEYDSQYGDCCKKLCLAISKCKAIYDAGGGKVCVTAKYKLGNTNYTTRCPSSCLY